MLCIMVHHRSSHVHWPLVHVATFKDLEDQTSTFRAHTMRVRTVLDQSRFCTVKIYAPTAVQVESLGSWSIRTNYYNYGFSCLVK